MTHIPPGYEVIAQIGSGAMGIVYKAVQKQLGRTVALKCMKPELAPSRQWVERFHREAQALARVVHPGLVKLYDVGGDAATPYLAMELIEGRPLDAVIEAQPVEVRRRADVLFRQMLDAVETLHAAGLAHRDLKPANVMVTADWKPVVMDLGLVKDFEGDGTVLTRPGAVLGTPAFLAPEVIQGEVASFQSDVWSLGCIYFTLHAGRPPFSAGSIPELFAAITRDPLPDLAAACPDMSEPRRRFLLKMLDRDPAKRPKNARKVLEELRRAVGVSAPNFRPIRTSAVSAGRFRALPQMALVLGLLAAMGAAVLRRARPVESPRAIASPAGASASAAAPPVPPVEDLALRQTFLDRLCTRDSLVFPTLVRDLLAIGKHPAPLPGQLARQRDLIARWMRQRQELDLADVLPALPRWFADPALAGDVKYRLYRGVNALSALDGAGEVSIGAPPLDCDRLAAPYVRVERDTSRTVEGYRPIGNLPQPAVRKLLETSPLVLFALMPPETGLFPESWWDVVQPVMQQLEVPGSREKGPVWYRMGELPQAPDPARGLTVSVVVSDMEPAFRLWVRFGGRRAVCLRNVKSLTGRGHPGVSQPTRAEVESTGVRLRAFAPEGFLEATDRSIEVGVDAFAPEAAYLVKFFYLLDLGIAAR